MLVYLAQPYDAGVVSVEVEKETPKRFYLKRETAVRLRGYLYYVPNIVDKDSNSYKIFTDLAAANQFCLGILRKQEDSLLASLERVRVEIAKWEGVA